jgi:hypothetical protein
MRVGTHRADLMQILCGRAAADLETQCRTRHMPASGPNARTKRMWPMNDSLWIAAMLGLLALTLAYARLCDNA